jgi:hypothetical protein
MPTIKYYNGIPIDEWKQNATTIWGISLHPLGELPIIDYMTEDSIPLHDIQARFLGHQLQLLLFALAIYPFFYGVIQSVKLILTRRQLIAGWCCLISAFCGIIISVIYAISIYIPELNCRKIHWSFGILIIVSILCHSIIIQYRAYLALRQQLWVLIVGSLLNLGHITNVFIIMTDSFMTIEPINGCVTYYSVILPYIYVLCNTPFNAFCFAIFIYVAYLQYRKFGNDSWKRLAKDSIYTMLVALICEITCDIIILFEIFGIASQLFFFINW